MNQTTLLRELKHCNLSLTDGHLHARCNILVKFPPKTQSIFYEPDVLTMEQLLVSEEAVRTVSQGCGPVCLSLRRVILKNWVGFPDNLNSSYDHFEVSRRSNVKPYGLYSPLEYIQQMTYEATFHKPPLVAVAMCESKLVNRSGIFTVYGFAERYHHAILASIDFVGLMDIIMHSNEGSVSTDAVRPVTGILEELPMKLWRSIEFLPIIHVAFHRCNFHHIFFAGESDLKSIQRLEFSQCPIESIGPLAFDDIPSVKNISLTSTKLPGIPKAIFSLKTLICLNMSDTEVPPGLEFYFWPVSHNTTSSAEQLITSGSNVKLLRDRDLCGFPNLHELHMDGCHLEILQGSPFVCLKKLQVLSLQANKISALSEVTLEGLTGLSLLNLNRNSLTVFEGRNILIPLMSLRVLHISFNSIEEFRVDKPLNSSPEVLFAQHNRITKWKPPIFSRMTEMKMLDLSHNEIAVLDN
ncbi:hypothetical protein HPB48_015763 [Haemaphysalis longicornis]|uniref:Uncharacterized protein n=1 Tax=Haemaphysalis longicornis TaxID=44386 RepID=A0A9J6GHM9_HAELO|nr:hypothetical protein HPB48_015763 [Haemaphysalis longicornis]